MEYYVGILAVLQIRTIFALPGTCDNWLGLVNNCVYYARSAPEIHQPMPFSVDFKAPWDPWNQMIRQWLVNAVSLRIKVPQAYDMTVKFKVTYTPDLYIFLLIFYTAVVTVSHIVNTFAEYAAGVHLHEIILGCHEIITQCSFDVQK